MEKNKADEKWYLWFSGFTDGEGSFAAGFIKRKNRFQLDLYFAIGLSTASSTGPSILDEIHKKLGIGTCCELIKHNAYRFAVYRRDELYRLRRIFDKYPLKVKRNDYEKWCRILDLWDSYKGRWRPPWLVLEIAKIADTMNIRYGKKKRVWSYEKLKRYYEDRGKL